MARRRPNSQSSVYISTDPQNNVPIGVPGHGVAIGRLGILLYGRGPDAIDAGSLQIDYTGDFQIDMTTQSIQAS